MLRRVMMAYGGGDPYWSSVSALLDFNGPNGSKVFTDMKPRSWMVGGDAKISTATSVFGDASGLFGGVGDYLKAASDPSLNLIGDFTIECWIRPAASAKDLVVIAKRGTGGTQNDYTLWVNASGKLRFLLWPPVGTGNPADAVGVTTVPAGAWSHTAVVRLGGNLFVYLNGVLDVTVAAPASVQASDSPLYIGRDSDTNQTRDFMGNIDELRITKGVARYTSNFTPPTAPFPTN